MTNNFPGNQYQNQNNGQNQNTYKTKARFSYVLNPRDNSTTLEVKVKASLTKDVEYGWTKGTGGKKVQEKAELSIALNGHTEELNSIFGNVFNPNSNGIFLKVTATGYSAKEIQRRGYKKRDWVGIVISNVTSYQSQSGNVTLSGFLDMDLNTARFPEGTENMEFQATPQAGNSYGTQQFNSYGNQGQGANPYGQQGGQQANPNQNQGQQSTFPSPDAPNQQQTPSNQQFPNPAQFGENPTAPTGMPSMPAGTNPYAGNFAGSQPDFSSAISISDDDLPF